MIIAVLKDALRVEEYGHLTTDDEIRVAGGVSAYDRIEVAPVLPKKEGRLSFVTSDPGAIDLDAYEALTVMRRAA